MSETLTTEIARRLGEIGLNKDAVRLFERWRKMAGQAGEEKFNKALIEMIDYREESEDERALHFNTDDNEKSMKHLISSDFYDKLAGLAFLEAALVAGDMHVLSLALHLMRNTDLKLPKIVNAVASW